MREWTKEPWDFELLDTEEASIYPSYDCEWTIALCADGVMSEHSGEANARRIVACVNACAGMDDPEAEIAAMRARHDAAEIAARADAKIERLREALEEIGSECLRGLHDKRYYSAMNTMANIAVAALKETEE